jgi:hypothetical protein
MTVNDLTLAELEELRSNWFYSEDRTIEELNKYDNEDEVPMSVIKEYYASTHFVSEDFFCNLND